MKLPRILDEKLKKRKRADSLRTLSAQYQGIDFSSNDYLGFSRSNTIYDKTLSLLDEYKIKMSGSSGSRLLSGNHFLFEEAERQLAAFHNSESALIYNSGYDANIGLISSVAQRGDFIFYDEYIHASLRDGIKLSNAKSYKFRHNSLVDLETKIDRIKSPESTIYIITESIFSMDGDAPDLKRMVDLARKHSALLIVDEAHATGVIGKCGTGMVQDLNLEYDFFARIHTFGKALGSHGAVILGSKRLMEFLVNYSRSFIYSTALSPHAIANIMTAYKELENTEATKNLKQNIAYFKEQISINKLESIFKSSDSQIQCCIIKGNEEVKRIAKKLLEEGYDVRPILSPTVPVNEERLRFCIHSYNKKEEIKSVLELLAKSITA